MPFLIGTSGNKKGRPRRGKSFSDLFDDELAKIVEADGTKYTCKQLIVKRAISEAIRGDIKAIQLCMERLEGKAVDAIRHDANSKDDDRAALPRIAAALDRFNSLATKPGDGSTPSIYDNYIRAQKPKDSNRQGEDSQSGNAE
jgi:hypothetical protein